MYVFLIKIVLHFKIPTVKLKDFPSIKVEIIDRFKWKYFNRYLLKYKL